MAQQGMTDVTQLEEYYETRLLDILGQIGKSYIVWCACVLGRRPGSLVLTGDAGRRSLTMG